MAKGLGWKVARKERGTRNLREPHPDSRHPRPAPCSQGRGGPRSEAGAWDARLPGSRAPGISASHGSPPGCSGLAGLGRASPHPSGALPSHLHLPGLAAAIMPPTSPEGATPKEAGGRSRHQPPHARRPGPGQSVDSELRRLDPISPYRSARLPAQRSERRLKQARSPPGRPKPMT